MHSKGKIQNGDRSLGVKCRMKSADNTPGGNTSALVEVRGNPLKSGENACIFFFVL